MAVTGGRDDGRCHFLHCCDIKVKSYQKEVSIYEEVDGAIYSYDVSCDFYVD